MIDSKRVYAASTDAQQPNSKKHSIMEKEQLDLEVVRSEATKKQLPQSVQELERLAQCVLSVVLMT